MLHAKGKKPKPPPKPQQTVRSKTRQWSPGSDVACCAAEAFGAVVIASGRPWSAGDTLALYWSTASDPDAGASVWATLESARGRWPSGTSKETGLEVISGPRTYNTPFILGLALPEPHAVAVDLNGRWWSWGEPFNPDDWPGLVVEEAWAVRI